MSTPLPALALTQRAGLLQRLGIVAAILVLETLVISYLVQASPIDLVTGPERSVRDIQHWLFRFVIAYVMSLAILGYLRGPQLLSAVSKLVSNAPVRLWWAGVHLPIFIMFASSTAALYGGTTSVPFVLGTAAWHGLAVASAVSLFAVIAPFATWRAALAKTGTLSLYALVPAGLAVAAIQGSQMLWAPTAAVTFRLVDLLLMPFLPTLRTDDATLTFSTDHFEVTVSQICSGLEGVGLMVIFCITWLWVFRREYYFPRALLIVPAAVSVIFLLNAVRIAALVLIGDAGYQGIATMGFHSQAGWIAFNLAALGVAVVAKHSTWLHRQGRVEATAHEDNAVAPYLMPLLSILAAGMVAHALSAGFDFLYPLRLVAAVVVLYAYRRRYSAVDWGFGWRGVSVGVLVFGVWAVASRYMTIPTARPEALATLSDPLRNTWIVCRTLAAVITVPIAEELAYRGFLLRRLVNADFSSIVYAQVRWTALAASSVLFGITHGGMWLPGVLAGLAYGAVVMRTGKLGEAIAAHGTTNAMLAAYVLLFDQWQLW